jgi:hypothetical protein
VSLPATFGTEDLSLKLIDKLDLLHELAVKEGIDFATRRTSGVRGFYRQSQMYAAWRANPVLAKQRFGIVALPAAPGLSLHHGWDRGLSYAVDIALPNRDTSEGTTRQARLGKLAESVGLAWGGRFKQPDNVHFSFPFDIFTANLRLMARVDDLMDQGEIEI